MNFASADELSAFSQAVAAYNERDLNQALWHAKEAVRQNPQHVDAHVLLGELYYLRQEMTKARKSWEKAAKLAPGREDVRQALAKLQLESAVENDLERSDTRPFILRFAGDSVPVDLGSLKEMLWDAHRQIGQQLSYFPGHNITVLLYPEADFQKVRSLSHPVAGLYDGKIRLPLKAGRTTGKELKRILWHEYTHALVHDLSKNRCPIWLNEGLATLQESRVSPPDLAPVRAALKQGKLPAWERLWSQVDYDPATLHLNYPTSYLIAQYLVNRGGWRRMVALLRRLGQGFPVQDALRAEYQMEPAALERDWRAWLNRQV